MFKNFSMALLLLLTALALSGCGMAIGHSLSNHILPSPVSSSYPAG